MATSEEYEKWAKENIEGVTSKNVFKNALPILAYYDIFKNYYANTQEENFYIIGNTEEIIATGVFKGVIDIDWNGLRCTSAPNITFTGTDVNLNDVKKIKFTVDSQDVYMQMPAANLYTIETDEDDKKVIGLPLFISLYFSTKNGIMS